MKIKGEESYEVPEDLKLPEDLSELSVWNFIFKNNLDAEIDYSSIKTTKLLRIEDSKGNNILKKIDE